MRNRMRLFVVAFFAAQIFSVSLIFADTIMLKTGQKIEGKITKKTEAFVRIEENGIPMTYFNEEISQIIETPLNPAAANPAVENPVEAKTANPLSTDEEKTDTKQDISKDPNYTEIFNMLKNFFVHQNDKDLTQCLTSLTDEFKERAQPNLERRNANDAGFITNIENFKITGLNLSGDTGKVKVSFVLKHRFLEEEEPEIYNVVKSITIKKERTDWKITNISGPGGGGPGGGELQ